MIDNRKYLEEVKKDCVFFNGYKPCSYIKNHNAKCNDSCQYFKKIGKKILIIKRGAAGEVIRNTPILHRLKQPNTYIVWITDHPDLIPTKYVDMVLKYGTDAVTILHNMEFDEVYSLDKEAEACSLANEIRAKKKKGFKLDSHGKIIPIDDDALHLWRNGIDDEYMKQNRKHYVESVFEVCGLDFNGEKYILPEYPEVKVSLQKGKKVIGLNIGVGKIWPTRKYSNELWRQLANKLVDKGYEVVLFGGKDEEQECISNALESGAKYYGAKPIKEYIGLMDNCDLVVTCVTLGLHVAIGLDKKVVLLNNIFNRHEFHSYGNGVILEPGVSCKMCYKTKFDDKCEAVPCQDLISPDRIIEEIELLLK